MCTVQGHYSTVYVAAPACESLQTTRVRGLQLPALRTCANNPSCVTLQPLPRPSRPCLHSAAMAHPRLTPRRLFQRQNDLYLAFLTELTAAASPMSMSSAAPFAGLSLLFLFFCCFFFFLPAPYPGFIFSKRSPTRELLRAAYASGRNWRRSLYRGHCLQASSTQAEAMDPVLPLCRATTNRSRPGETSGDTRAGSSRPQQASPHAVARVLLTPAGACELRK